MKGKYINKHKMVVKDSREVSYGMESDVEISFGKMKGLAKIKIWGPSKSATKKNQCTIIISRYPNADPMFSTELSRKIVRPLIESYLKGQGWKDIIQPLNSICSDRIKCTECFKSLGKRYLKTHVEKIHKAKGHNIVSNIILSDSQSKTEQVQVEINKVSEQPIILPKKHICEQCSISFKTYKELSEHNENIHIHGNWPDSGSKRDLSMVKTSSVYEPKRKKAADEEEMIERSKNMDRKIQEKRKKKKEYEEMLKKKELIERKQQDEIKHDLENKRRKGEKEKEQRKRESEKREKETKEFKEREFEKRENEKRERERKEIEKKQLYQPSNVKDLPHCVSSLYPDSLQYCVPGDGACCLNCLAAWILLDVSRGPQLARDLNTHMAEYMEYYINKLTFPLTIIIAGGERAVYDQGEENEFFDMLVSSPEACFM